MNELIHYSVDADDRINFFDQPFREFGAENTVPDEEVASYMGKPISAFFAGSETRQIYKLLLAKVRSGRKLAFPFRCDAPSLRRFLVMTMEPSGAGGVAFITRLLRVEDRQPVALLAANVLRNDEMVRMCSWCKRIVVDDAYAEVEDAVIRLKLFSAMPMPRITHGICDTCYRHVTAA